MKIGCVKEIKRHEYRVGMTPDCAAAYKAHGHSVTIQAGAGTEAGFPDEQYKAAGAAIEADAKKIFAESDMIIKVKEPQESEFPLFHEGQILYTYLHLAPDEPQTKALLKAKIIGIAYETMQLADGTLPCLKPMSEIAGRLAIQEGAKYLERPFGGRGVLLSGVPGVPRGKVVILGGGVVGMNAAKIAAGMGADVTILDINANRLAYIDDIFGGKVQTLYSNEANVKACIAEADLVVGAVLIPGAKAPHLVRKEHLKLMKKHSVIVDVAVDQGGCIETTHATTHDNPVYLVDDVVHYCVANMPGAVARTSTLALTGTTLNYGLMIADKGAEAACKASPIIMKGLNVYKGHCTYKDVASAHGLEYMPAEKVI
ncbi:MAG: alanine dehydrogenase [Spirochaetaceae bacterium]|jgi:alanine dehydrogenase|nr:alanine dehydrogenase [Spirochaetaceae bacterium]